MPRRPHIIITGPAPRAGLAYRVRLVRELAIDLGPTVSGGIEWLSLGATFPLVPPGPVAIHAGGE